MAKKTTKTARVIPTTETYEEPKKKEKHTLISVERADGPTELTSIPHIIADSKIFYRNARIPGSDEAFPYEPKLRTVDRFYPYAKGGALCVDECWVDGTAEVARRKTALIKKAGWKHLILVRELQLDDAMRQIMEQEEA